MPSGPGQRCVEIDEQMEAEVHILKQIARQCILERPALAAQQRGQKRIITELFEDLFEPGSEKYLPERFSDLFKSSVSKPRRVADCISSLTEKEAVALHARLRGIDAGSVLDPIVR